MSDVAIIGAGKIAFSLTRALLEISENIICVVSRTRKSAGLLADKFGIGFYTDNYSEIPTETRLFFLAVPDGEITPTALKLSECNLDFKNSLFIHLSGSQTVLQLDALRHKGAAVASLHIMQTFPSRDAAEIRGAYAAIESIDAQTQDSLTTLAKKMGMQPFYIESADKIFYHIAGVFASNFLIANLYNSQQSFNMSKAEGVDFINMIKPIVRSSLENAGKEGIIRALSGPVDRVDIETIENHLRALKTKSIIPDEGKNGVNVLFLNYISQSLILLEISKIKNQIPREKYDKIRQLLLGELKESISAGTI
ncbi:MAG: Rossmann-like and DUF2520 domain-containing protein [Ignavibacteriales bacterium]